MFLTYHSVFFALGALLTANLYTRTVRSRGLIAHFLPIEEICFIFFVGLIGARLSYAVINAEENLIEYISFWHVGLVSWGGIITGLVAAWFLYHRRVDSQLWFDLLVISVIPGFIVGRLGNLLERDAYGITSSYSPFYGRVPVVLYEIIALSLLFIYLLRLQKRWPKWQGYILGLTLIYYGAVRVVIDYWRELPAVWLGMNSSQLAAATLFTCAMISTWYSKKIHTLTPHSLRNKKRNLR